MRNLGSAGVKVSTLCLGAMTFGEVDEKSMMYKVGCDEDTSLALMDRALAAGVNFYDTADVYGPDGMSERIVGRWLRERRTRDKIVLATKFRFRMGEGANDTGASRYHIVRAVEDSLERLGTDRIDLYQIHMQDLDAPEEETLRALDDLVRAGKVLYIGCSNYAAYRLADSLWTSKLRGWERFVTLQAQYSLLERGIERELVPLCRTHGLGILPWSPLAGGFLTGKFKKDAPPPEGARMSVWKGRLEQFDRDRNWRILDAVEGAARELSATASQVALAWVIAQPQVSSVIFGARSLAQLDDNLKAAELTLPAPLAAKIDEAARFDLGYPYDFLRRVQKRW
jgi:aryl-alcohol dehydrogenase-like predicted oxidoreductase